MGRKKKSHLHINDLRQLFREAVEEYWDLMNCRSLKKDRDAAFKRLLAVTRELESREREERMTLLPLLDDSSPGIRLHAAHELADLVPDTVIPVYEELQRHIGLASVYAHSALDRIRGVDSFNGEPPLLP